MVLQRVGGVFIPVTNLEKSIEWYSATFDVEQVDNWGTGAGFKFRKGEALLALVQVDSPQTTTFSLPDGSPHCYFNFEVSDIEEAHRELKDKGRIVSDIEHHGNIIAIFDVTDPDGNTLSFVSEKADSPYKGHATGKTGW
ncbi:VOC family protein [Paenibacillus xylaniclasticus]|uniref:VOC family protein n=1 Tax=Paenibacillus xylaniclasticus TaxID=588083 RepID=UPI000FD93F2A|nr:VOC family protein [Paenibacillus xylaniclasticus]